MTLLAFKWRNIWTMINNYHLGVPDRTRRVRIREAYAILCGIKEADFGYESEEENDSGDLLADSENPNWAKSQKLMAEWLKSSSRGGMWRKCVNQMRKWSPVADPIAAKLLNALCRKCNTAQAMHN